MRYVHVITFCLQKNYNDAKVQKQMTIHYKIRLFLKDFR